MAHHLFGRHCTCRLLSACTYPRLRAVIHHRRWHPSGTLTGDPSRDFVIRALCGGVPFFRRRWLGGLGGPAVNESADSEHPVGSATLYPLSCFLSRVDALALFVPAAQRLSGVLCVFGGENKHRRSGARTMKGLRLPRF